MAWDALSSHERPWIWARWSSVSSLQLDECRVGGVSLSSLTEDETHHPEIRTSGVSCFHGQNTFIICPVMLTLFPARSFRNVFFTCKGAS